MLAVVDGTCNPLDDWGRGLPMSSRLGLAIEWDHVSKTKTKQKTSRKLFPSPSPHPQTSSFNPLYQDLALHLLSLLVLPIFLVTLIRYRPRTRYPLKTRKLPRFQSFWTLTWGCKWKTPPQSLCLFTQRHWKFYTKWHRSCVCVRCEWNINSSVQTWAPPPQSFRVVHSNTATSKKNMKFKTHLVSSISDKGYSVCITGPVLSCSFWQLQRSMCSML